MVVERDGIRAVFSRDARGALKLCLEGHGLSKAELQRLGEELIGRVTQQYAYHRVVSELKERQMDIVEERVGEDQAITDPRPQRLSEGATDGPRRIEIEIGADGKVTVRTLGIKGPRCVDVAEAIAQLIGREESRQLTDEYYEAGVQAQSHIEQKLAER